MDNGKLLVVNHCPIILAIQESDRDAPIGSAKNQNSKSCANCYTSIFFVFF